MAQKKTTSSRGKSTSGSKKPTSTARKPSTSGKTTSKNASSGKKSTSTAKKPETKKSAAAVPERRPIRRQVGCFVLLFFGMIGCVAYFQTDGWLLNAYRNLFMGLIGWGFYIMPAAMLWGSVILGFHRGRPVQARLICTLCLPIVAGTFVHMAAFAREGLFATNFSYGIRNLWMLAQTPGEHCGGVVSGLIAVGLESSIGIIGGFLVMVVAAVILIMKAFDLSVESLAEMMKNRPVYEPEEPYEPGEEEFFSPDDYLFPLDGGEPIQKKSRKNAGKSAQPVPPAEFVMTGRARTPLVYDEQWELQKDKLFAAMEVDPEAARRVAAAMGEEKPVRNRKSAGRTEKPEAPKPEAKKEAPKADAKKPAEEITRNVKPLSLEDAADIAGVEIHSADLDDGAAAAQPVEKIKIDKDAEAALVAEEIAAGEEEKAEYVFPSLDLLNKSRAGGDEDGETEDENAIQLENAIRSFGVGATIVGAVHGPTVTRYELLLDRGVKLNKITNLAGDIALSMGVENVRIAPIPDKVSTVGVEVPNRNVKTVWLGDLIDSTSFQNAKSKLSFAVGKDISGNVIVGNIAKMPHVLIAGTTGSGKSVCINSLILSLLYKSSPEEVRMIMIDPKMVELGIYNGMPHLYVPVVTDPKKAAGALQWSVVEMLKRYRLFSEAGVRDLAGYNLIMKNEDQPTLPQVVIIIDELADLMMVASKEVEESICRVAQMGRAAGMHLVVATQRPSSDVITGLMKANIPSRIAFAVSSALESRIILDQQGAEKLIGAGDMLYAPLGSGKPVRVQGAFVTDEEREEIINFVKREAQAEYSDEIIAQIEKAAEDKNAKAEEKDSGKPQNDYDELLPQAVDVIFETKQASVSMLQRRLKLGYSRAARLIDQLEEVGVVGPFEGSKPRQIIITKQQWQEMQYSAGTAPVDTIAQEFAQVAEDDAFASVPEAELSGEDTPTDELPWDEEN